MCPSPLPFLLRKHTSLEDNSVVWDVIIYMGNVNTPRIPNIEVEGSGESNKR
jgi:hypothetical protein